VITLQHPVVEEVLYQGLEDWVGLTTIASLITEEAPSWWQKDEAPGPDDVKTETLAVCDFLLSNDLMRAGELSNSTADPSDFLDWPGEPPQIMERIARDWDALMSLDRFEPCWFRSTESGREAGEAINA
jgi:hypothetical protein